MTRIEHLFYAGAAMVICRSCHREIPHCDIANPEAWRGEDSVTCVGCAALAVATERSRGRLHRLNARDPGTRARVAYRRATGGYNPDGLALVETWAFCDRCLAYLKERRVARFKTDGRMIRWTETDYGHPVPAHQVCDACHRRRATKFAVVRIASRAAPATS